MLSSSSNATGRLQVATLPGAGNGLTRGPEHITKRVERDVVWGGRAKLCAATDVRMVMRPSLESWVDLVTDAASERRRDFAATRRSAVIWRKIWI